MLVSTQQRRKLCSSIRNPKTRQTTLNFIMSGWRYQFDPDPLAPYKLNSTHTRVHSSNITHLSTCARLQWFKQSWSPSYNSNSQLYIYLNEWQGHSDRRSDLHFHVLSSYVLSTLVFSMFPDFLFGTVEKNFFILIPRELSKQKDFIYQLPCSIWDTNVKH